MFFSRKKHEMKKNGFFHNPTHAHNRADSKTSILFLG